METEKPKEVQEFFLFSDGSCINNGKPNARGGIGILGLYTKDLTPYPGFVQYSKPYDMKIKVSNQRCELLAIKEALEIAKDKLKVKPAKLTIITDSMYSMNCVTVWCKKWVKNNWQSTSGKPVEHQDLIKPILERITELEKLGIKIVFQHINSHQKAPKRITEEATPKEKEAYKSQLFLWNGNKKVDELARKATKPN